MTKLKLYGGGSRSLKCKLTASFAGVELELAPFTMGITNKTPEFLAINPIGKASCDVDLRTPFLPPALLPTPPSCNLLPESAMPSLLALA